ncbi:MAG: hypothetical protein H7338_24530 [Candidatus Sericytochromatia bacterium]|nr:hypothetical protein [Candidatus Sericytochromatia bacterium]
MSRYRVNVAFRGKLSFDVDAASEQEAEEQALATWESSAIQRDSDSAEILSLKAEANADGRTRRDRPAQSTTRQQARTVTQGAIIIETEATTVGESTDEPMDEPETTPTAKRPRSIWAYAWTAFWLAVLVGLAQLGSR